MKLTVLVNNDVDLSAPYYYGEPGLSYYIEDEGKRILFDAGYSDLALKNAEKMGLDLNGLDYAVFSHGHDDHTRGLKFLVEAGIDFSKTTLVMHPDALIPKWDGDEYIGFPFLKTEIYNIFGKVVLSDKPYKLTERLTFLGGIPRTNDFENKTPVCEVERPDGSHVPDYLSDDTALVYKRGDGIFIISACSHSGICNASEYAITVTGEERIRGIIGGLHMTHGVDERVHKTIDYLKVKNKGWLYPGHCCLFHARAEMYKELDSEKTPVRDMVVGMRLEL